MTLDHYLRPLVAPSSVALIGASERPGSLGRIVYENILAGGFQGEIFAVNPNHKRVLGRRALRSLAALKKPVELAVIATPCEHVSRVLAEGGAAGLKAAVILTAPPPTTAAAQQWEREIARVAAKYRIRILGTAAFGVIRTDLGLNATMGSVQALPGRLALIAQSGAVCSALLDFATPLGIGFSSVLAMFRTRSVEHAAGLALRDSTRGIFDGDGPAGEAAKPSKPTPKPKPSSNARARVVGGTINPSNPSGGRAG